MTPRVIAVFNSLPKMPPRQDSTDEQLADLVIIANKLGMYDAADVIKTMQDKNKEATK